MDRPKVILVATDFGEPAEAALTTAVGYAQVFGSEIVLMHAFEIPIVGFPDGAVLDVAELSTRMMEGAQQGLDRVMRLRQGSGVPMRGIVKLGDPWRMVNETAAEVGADLVVLGTHGRRGLSRALLGSVAEKVVRTSPVPVLTVHPTEVPEEQPVASEAPPTAR